SGAPRVSDLWSLLRLHLPTRPERPGPRAAWSGYPWREPGELLRSGRPPHQTTQVGCPAVRVRGYRRYLRRCNVVRPRTDDQPPQGRSSGTVEGRRRGYYGVEVRPRGPLPQPSDVGQP